MSTKKTFVRSLALLLALALSLACLAGCTPKEPTPSGNTDNTPVETKTIHFASTVQNTMPGGAACKYFCELINERTEGRYECVYHPGGELGQTDELLTNVMSGTLELAQISISNISSYTNALECVQYPFLLSDYNKEKAAFQSNEFKAIMSDVDSTLGVHNLIIMEHGARHFANNVRPIATPQDASGIKMRVSTTKTNLAILQAIGISPVSLPYSQVYSGLQSNTIEGEEINYTSVYSEKHYEVLKYFTDMQLWPFPAMMMMSQSFWDSLSAQDQEIFTKAAQDAFNYNFELLEEATATAKKTMEDKGIEITTVTDNSAFATIAAPFIEEAMKDKPLAQNFVKMTQNLK